MTVRRYEPAVDKYGDGTVIESQHGDFVTYDDYAAVTEQVRQLTEQRDALVAECLSLKSAIIDIEEKYMNWEGLGDAFAAAKTTPTPATDKAISERENDGGSK